VQIGVISDTHLTRYDEQLARALARHFGGVDLVLHAGDLVDLAVLDMFPCRDVRAVRGNMDLPSVRRFLPETLTLRLGPFTVGLVHGSGGAAGIEERLLPLFPGLDCLVYGHTHVPVNHVRGGVLMFNPGSARLGRPPSRTTVGVIEITNVLNGRIVVL
jgi:uncharacterized protein